MRLTPLLAAAMVLSACAATQPDKDHAAHHPPGAAAPSTSPSPAQVDEQMKAMRAMHDKMMSAKTPDERQALMAEHMKAMRDGMSMMCEMAEMKKRCMGMKDMTMQMMTDREPVRAPAAN